MVVSRKVIIEEGGVPVATPDNHLIGGVNLDLKNGEPRQDAEHSKDQIRLGVEQPGQVAPASETEASEPSVMVQSEPLSRANLPPMKVTPDIEKIRANLKTFVQNSLNTSGAIEASAAMDAVIGDKEE